MSGTVRFGLYTADLHAAELKKGHDSVPLQNLPFRILAILLREPGRVVTREELRLELWPADTFVDFERGISTAVSKLRDALGDSAANPRYIQTVGRRGYRFIAPVTVLAQANGLRADGTTGLPVVEREFPPLPRLLAKAPPPSWHSSLAYPAAVLVLVASIALLWKVRPAPPGTAPPPIRSIAVLPLDNLSGDPQQEYLSDGLTDAITTGLAQIPGLRVISRTTSMHYKHSQRTTPDIARELGVDALVAGSVIRSGDQLRLNVQLIHARSDRHLWANSYERELANVLMLQGELAREIADEIQLHLTPEQQQSLSNGRPVDPETYVLYLQGRFYWHQRKEQELTKAIAYFQQAIARDPDFAPAYAGLADSYVVLSFFVSAEPTPLYAEAHKASRKALSLDSKLAEAHNSEAYARIYQDWDFKGAEEEFKIALSINPNYATAHQWYAELLSLEARHTEAMAQVTRALELDPLSAVVHHQAGQIFRTAKQYDRALAEYQTSLQLDRHFHQNHFAMYRLFRESGRRDDAVDELQRAMHGIPAMDEALAQAARAYHTRGWNAFLKKSLPTWELTGWAVAPYYKSWDYAGLGDFDSAMKVLEQEYAKRNPMVLNARTDPELDVLRSDPRFQDLLRRIGLP
jgi:TolB-like protein/DNA-binding winged helix-turn-helix (wHTH) protein/Tfp pilus assembly protein PilF